MNNNVVKYTALFIAVVWLILTVINIINKDVFTSIGCVLLAIGAICLFFAKKAENRNKQNDSKE